MISDGTAAGTTRIADIYSGIAHKQIYDAKNDRIFFTGRKNIFITSQADEELWVTDGTKTGTVQVKDIEPTPGYGSNPSNFVLLDSKLYFSAEGTKRGFFISDGTEIGTVRLSSTCMLEQTIPTLQVLAILTLSKNLLCFFSPPMALLALSRIKWSFP